MANEFKEKLELGKGGCEELLVAGRDRGGSTSAHHQKSSQFRLLTAPGCIFS